MNSVHIYAAPGVSVDVVYVGVHAQVEGDNERNGLLWVPGAVLADSQPVHHILVEGELPGVE